MTGHEAAPAKSRRDILVGAGEIAPLLPLIADLRAPRGADLGGLGDLDGGTISLADLFRLLHELALGVGEETFQLSARPLVAGTAEMVLSRAGACATVGEAMREIARGYNVMHGDNYNRVQPLGRTLSYVVNDEHFPYTRPRDDFLHFSLECALIHLHAALCELADEDLGRYVRKVSTRRSPQAQMGGALQFWDAPIVRGAAGYGLTYDAAIAAHPVSRHRRTMAPDLAAHNRIISLIEARQTGAPREGLEAAVLRAFHDGLHDQNRIAARLGLSTATLRRRLAAEGVNFRELHRQVLNLEARAKLLDLRDIGAVAEALGFSDTRSFTRAFKTWNRTTPSAFIQAANGTGERSGVSENVPSRLS